MTDYPFPFIGAGDAAYFEWAEVFVRFQKLPPKAKRRKIEAAVPPPLQDTVEWKGPMLWLASAQGVGRYIKAAYTKGKKAGKVSALTTTSRFAQASASADARFNAHIEQFLLDCHKQSPVLFAFRREDHEAGGTQLSDWHKQSIKKAPELVAEMAKAPGEMDAEVAKPLIAWARESKVKIAKELPASLAEAGKKAEEAERMARQQEDQARRKKAASFLKGKSQKSKTLSAAALKKNLTALAKNLPKTAKRLGRLKDGEFDFRPGASAAALKASEKKLGFNLHPDHAALLKAFDGGTFGELCFLGTEAGGSRGKDEVVAFTYAHFGHHDNKTSAIVVRSDLHRFVSIEPKRAPILKGDPGARGHLIIKDCKTLDAALDVVLKNKRCGRRPSGSESLSERLTVQIKKCQADPSQENLAALAPLCDHEQTTAANLYDRACFMGQSGHHGLALVLLEYAQKKPDPSWQVFSNALAHAMLSSSGADELRQKVTPWLSRGKHLEKVQPAYLHNLACVHIRLGDQEACLETLEKAVAAGLSKDVIQGDGDFDPLRKNKRYLKLMS